LNKFKNSGIV